MVAKWILNTIYEESSLECTSLYSLEVESSMINQVDNLRRHQSHKKRIFLHQKEKTQAIITNAHTKWSFFYFGVITSDVDSWSEFLKTTKMSLQLFNMKLNRIDNLYFVTNYLRQRDIFRSATLLIESKCCLCADVKDDHRNYSVSLWLKTCFKHFCNSYVF